MSINVDLQPKDKFVVHLGLGAGDGKDGLSAYEIAVKNGFSGSEEEWLESLKGKNGKDGTDGYTPQKGLDYFDGKNGESGSDGVSPTVEVVPIDGGHIVYITDVNGTKSFSVMDGSKLATEKEIYIAHGLFDPIENAVVFFDGTTFVKLFEAVDVDSQYSVLALGFGTDHTAVLPMSHIRTDRIVFEGTLDLNGIRQSVSVEIFSDDTNKVTITENTGGTYYVNATIDDNFSTFTPNKTLEEIVSALEKGQSVIIMAETSNSEIVFLPLTIGYDEGLCFSGAIKIYNDSYIASAEMPVNGTNKITLTKVPQSGEYATKSEIGNINAILDNINGAVI